MSVPCPIKSSELAYRKHQSQQKARSDQRTRERLPLLPALVRAAEKVWKDAAARLEAAHETQAGCAFTILGLTLTKPRGKQWRDPNKTTTVYREDGSQSNLALAENRAFWAWAGVEFFRHTGTRIEEMLEVSHHSIVQFKLPDTGEIVPLLQIAPSKTDEERLLLVTPELADVLSIIVSRVRDSSGAVPLVSAYDVGEKVWNPPLPLLFQWHISGQNRAVAVTTIRKGLNDAIQMAGLTDPLGRPINFQPHDFRRIFVTDAILNGLPPHIAQVICGHKNINTTMGYNTIYPTQVIEAHRAFIARRRSLRPGEEYRTRRRRSGRRSSATSSAASSPWGSADEHSAPPAIHEHACVRCSMLRVDPAERPRLIEIRDNLVARIAEAEREGWLGEIEGLQVSLAGAEDKLAQLDAGQDRESTVIDLGMPTFNQIAARITNAKGSNPSMVTPQTG